MTVEQHNRAVEISKELREYSEHKEKVKAMANGRGNDPEGNHFYLLFYRSGWESLTVEKSVAPIPLQTFTALYLSAIDAKIKELETEFANL